jgi:arylformamidase
MPYLLSRPIHPSVPELWKEGAPYQRTSIYDGCHEDASPSSPPVRYDAHILKPHSLAHADAPAHILKNRRTIDSYFSTQWEGSPFWGKAVVIRVPKTSFENQVCRLSLPLLKKLLQKATGNADIPERLLITADDLPASPDLSHPADWPLVLDEEAANDLVSARHFVLFGTSWKSTDFMRGSRERPIHRILFQRALLFECLDLTAVPAGEYFWVGVPLRLQGASESPVCPVLFTRDELGDF